jgi:beta-lactamase superfamily II metal-dependent hydrolase
MIVSGVSFILLAGACGGGDGGSGSPTSPTPTVAADRPASTAKLAIVSPRNGQVVQGSTVQLKVSLKDAKVVRSANTDIVPDEGHLHVSLDDQVITMTGDLEQLVADLTPGQHLLKVEFVASDHAPFDPRVIAAVAFEVKA